MLNKKEAQTKFLSISKDIETELDEILSNQKGDIEKELEEQIQRMKEDAERKIAKNTAEIDEEKKGLKEYALLMAELEEEGNEFRYTMDHHLNRAAKFRKEIWKLLESMGKEFKSVMELEKNYKKIQNDAFQRANILKEHLKEIYGLKSVVPEKHVFNEKLKIDLAHETEKLQKAKVLMGPLDVSEAEEHALGLEHSA